MRPNTIYNLASGNRTKNSALDSLDTFNGYSSPAVAVLYPSPYESCAMSINISSPVSSFNKHLKLLIGPKHIESYLKDTILRIVS